MADWKKHYSERLTSVEEAAKCINSGDTIYFGSTLCVPGSFMDALADRHEELSDVTLIANMYLTPAKILMDTMYKKSFHTITMFANMLERMAAKQNNIDFNPTAYGDLPAAITDVYKANVVCVEVCPADEDGNFNTGVLGTNFTPQHYAPRLRKNAYCRCQ